MRHYFQLTCVVYYDHDHENDDYPPDADDMGTHFDAVFSDAQNHREELCEEVQLVGPAKFEPLTLEQVEFRTGGKS